MAQVRSVDPNALIYKRLRDPWVEGHPELAAAKAAIAEAEEAAKHVAWQADPLAFAEANRKALASIDDAKRNFAEVTSRLRKQYNDELGITD